MDTFEEEAELLLYETEDGCTRVECRFADDSMWLWQALMAELFQVSVPTINEHLKKLFADREIQPESTFRKYLIVRQEGARQVSRQIDHYSLAREYVIGESLHYLDHNQVSPGCVVPAASAGPSSAPNGCPCSLQIDADSHSLIDNLPTIVATGNTPKRNAQVR